ncbi:MAG: Lrp/AsnC family transcriptional regulator [Cohaesibacter sp.]|nr:Lrp/AsnC family transcriptional regulator [Cohaesibacter sp.]MCV6600299.1 Lrp/AsnC family transcriptional regulator [Cohaesibacter sp.]
MLDENDQKLLQLLTINARTPVSTLAKKLNIARTTAQARLDRLEHRGIIKGYTVKLGMKEERFSVRATTLLKLAPQTTDSLVSKLQNYIEISSAVILSGRYDVKIEILVPSISQLDTTLRMIGDLEGVEEIETLIHLS